MNGNLEWKKWKSKSDVPIEEILLFEVKNSNRDDSEYHTGKFHKCGRGGKDIIGAIGGRFYYDWTEIVRWASIQHLLGE